MGTLNERVIAVLDGNGLTGFSIYRDSRERLIVAPPGRDAHARAILLVKCMNRLRDNGLSAEPRDGLLYVSDRRESHE